MNKPAEPEKFYSLNKVARSLVTLAKKHGLEQLRASSGESTIGRPHLLQLLERLKATIEIFLWLASSKSFHQIEMQMQI